MATVLVIDDDQNLRETLAELFAGEGHAVQQAADGEQAIAQLHDSPPDVALCDWRMSPTGGLQVLRAFASVGADAPPVIVLTAYGDAESTVEAMQAGAYDLLVKPVDADAVLATVSRALEQVKLQRTLERLQAERFRDGKLSVAPANAGASAPIGRSPAWIEAFKRVGQVAQTELTVLLEGETGTGKEVVARLIHRSSHRAQGPFVAVNCAAIPEDLVESELFGHERGAFTGAALQRVGSFEQAAHGTLFLDEIGEMPLHVQPKLLRILQERSFQRLGGTRVLQANVRIIAATNLNLAQQVEQGRFRADLFYRLDAYHIQLPPLRERRADISLLSEYFLGRFAAANSLAVSALGPGALAALQAHDFPGNVRELEHMLNKLAVEAAGRPIQASAVQALLQRQTQEERGNLAQWEQLPFHDAVARFEQHLIRRALELSAGNKSDAARRLGIQRRLLYEKLQGFARRS